MPDSRHAEDDPVPRKRSRRHKLDDDEEVGTFEFEGKRRICYPTLFSDAQEDEADPLELQNVVFLNEDEEIEVRIKSEVFESVDYDDELDHSF